MPKEHSEEYYQALAKLLTTSLEEVKGVLSEQDYNDVRDYIDHGEYGVGWDLLWELLNLRQLSPPVGLIECGRKMGFDVSTP